MNIHLRQIKTPLLFFDHELDNLNENRDYSDLKFFAFVDNNGKLVRKQLYFPYEINDNFRYGKNIMIMRKLIERRYSQSIIDSTKAEYKKRGLKQYEWRYDTYDVAIDAETGDEIYVVDNKRCVVENHLYVYDNVIVETGPNSRNKIINRRGEILWEGDTNYGNLMNTKDYIIINIKHDYSTRLDKVLIIDKKLGIITQEL